MPVLCKQQTAGCRNGRRPRVAVRSPAQVAKATAHACETLAHLGAKPGQIMPIKHIQLALIWHMHPRSWRKASTCAHGRHVICVRRVRGAPRPSAGPQLMMHTAAEVQRSPVLFARSSTASMSGRSGSCAANSTDARRAVSTAADKRRCAASARSAWEKGRLCRGEAASVAGSAGNEAAVPWLGHSKATARQGVTSPSRQAGQPGV